MEEYLTVKELSDRIKFSKQSLYNLIHKGTFVLGKHYLKPTPKKVLFKWSEIRFWMGDSCSMVKNESHKVPEDTYSKNSDAQSNSMTASFINI